MKSHMDRRSIPDRRLCQDGSYRSELNSSKERRSEQERRSYLDERRRNARLKTKDRAYVGIRKPLLFNLFKRRIDNFAEIIDISLGGLRGQYVATKMWTPEFDKLSISTADKRMKINNIPFKILSDFKVSCQSNDMVSRIFGVKFGKLSSEQISMLNDFIQTYTD